MPYSPVGAYIQSLDLGEIELVLDETAKAKTRNSYGRNV